MTKELSFAKKILKRALKLTEKYKLTKGTFYRNSDYENVDGGAERLDACCTLGFIYLASNQIEEKTMAATSSEISGARRLVTNKLNDLVPGGRVTIWNDLGRRRKGHVKALFRKALAEL